MRPQFPFVQVHLLENSSDCYTEFGEGWSYVCIPSEANDALGVAYEINGSLFLWPSPLHAVEGGVEFAAMHLHRSKAKFSMEDCRDSEDVSCQKDRGPHFLNFVLLNISLYWTAQ